MSELNPITRKEMFLAAAAGQDIELPTPITRKEMFLAKIAQGGGTGGGSSAPSDWNAAEGQLGHVLNRTHWAENGDVDIASGTYSSKYNETMRFFYIALGWEAILDETPEIKTVELDGIFYNNLASAQITGFGNAVGNLSYINSIAGTSFENTGEPFLMFFNEGGGDLYVLDTQPTEHTVFVKMSDVITHRLPVEYTPCTVLDMRKLGFPKLPSADEKIITVQGDYADIVKMVKGLVMVRFTNASGAYYTSFACPSRNANSLVIFEVVANVERYIFHIAVNHIRCEFRSL